MQVSSLLWNRKKNERFLFRSQKLHEKKLQNRAEKLGKLGFEVKEDDGNSAYNYQHGTHNEELFKCRLEASKEQQR
jgi:hypothetical protein